MSHNRTPNAAETARVTPKPVREEQAWQEIGHTVFSPGVRVFLPVVFLLILVTVPLVQFLIPDSAYARLCGATGTETPPSEPVQGRTITATVSAISRPPDRNGVYKDFLMRLHLTGVEGIEPGEIVLTVVAMRNRVVHPVAGIVAGARISAVVRDWSNVDKALGGINGSHLDGTQFISMPIYYGETVHVQGTSDRPTGKGFLAVWSGSGNELPPDARVGVWAGMQRAWSRNGSLLSSFLASNRHLSQRIHLFEDALDDTSVPTLLLRSPVQALLTRAGVGNEKAYVGRDHWLFYAPGVRSITEKGFLDPKKLLQRAREGEGPDCPQPDPRKAILHFHDQLTARGIKLVLIPTPVKPTIHPEKLSARMPPNQPVRNRSFEAFISDLKASGVTVYDPTPLLMKRKEEAPQYLAADTHWTPDAMAAVAADMAACIGSDVPPVPAPQWHFQTNTITQHGDIAVMLGLPDGQKIIPPDTVCVRTITTPESQWLSEKADVLLLGDSFSNIYSLEGMGWGSSAGFAENLAVALNRPIDRISRNDAGAHASRQMLVEALNRNPNRLTGKRLVIWQFAERELAIGDWKILNLPAAQTTTTTTPETRRDIPAKVAVSASPANADCRSEFQRLAEEADRNDKTVVSGRDGWLFLTAELRHLGHGPFWGKHAPSEDTDPLNAIVDLNAKLKTLGIEMIFCPAPPRAVVYADRLIPSVPTNAFGAPARVDGDLQAFYTTLREKGVTVVDVTDAFLEARQQDSELGPVCCEQDTHWSPRGLQIAARAVARQLQTAEWKKDVPAGSFTVQPPAPLAYAGDLVEISGLKTAGKSRTSVVRVTADEKGDTPFAFDDNSPVLLLADSHGLVFSSGDDMHCTSAGFGEHLSAELGFAVDLMAKRGSGDQVRIDLARRFLRSSDDARKKRVLVYTFAARTLSEGRNWKLVPLTR